MGSAITYGYGHGGPGNGDMAAWDYRERGGHDGGAVEVGPFTGDGRDRWRRVAHFNYSGFESKTHERVGESQIQGDVCVDAHGESTGS